MSAANRLPAAPAMTIDVEAADIVESERCATLMQAAPLLHAVAIAGVSRVLARIENSHSSRWELVDRPTEDRDFMKFTRDGVRRGVANAKTNWNALMDGVSPLLGAKLIRTDKNGKESITAAVVVAAFPGGAYAIGRIYALAKASKGEVDEIRAKLALRMRQGGARTILVLAETTGRDDGKYLTRFTKLPKKLDDETANLIEDLCGVFGFANTLGAGGKRPQVLISGEGRPQVRPLISLQDAEIGGEFEGGVDGLAKLKLHGKANLKAQE